MAVTTFANDCQLRGIDKRQVQLTLGTFQQFLALVEVHRQRSHGFTAMPQLEARESTGFRAVFQLGLSVECTQGEEAILYARLLKVVFGVM